MTTKVCLPPDGGTGCTPPSPSNSNPMPYIVYLDEAGDHSLEFVRHSNSTQGAHK